MKNLSKFFFIFEKTEYESYLISPTHLVYQHLPYFAPESPPDPPASIHDKCTDYNYDHYKSSHREPLKHK